jgi:hypothetical protein
MGTRREPSNGPGKPARVWKTPSRCSTRCGYSAIVRRLLGMDGERLHRLSGIQASAWCARRIQRQVHVRPNDSARGIVRHSCESYSGDLSKFLFTNNQMAVHRDSFGRLKGLVQMATYLETVELEHLATADEREALTREVRRGLIARPRSLSPWMFYDAEGSRLFERITTLPEYYPTRTERAILAGNADAIVARAHNDRSLPLRLVELGAGTASKTCILLEAALRFRTTSLMCQSMSVPTLSSWRAKTLHARCRKCAYSRSSGTT